MDLKKYPRYRSMIDEVKRIYLNALISSFIILGSLLAFGIFCLVEYTNIFTILIVPVMSLLIILILGLQLKNYIKPETSKYIRSIPDLPALLEDLEQNETKVEGFYVGNRAIVSMNNPLLISDFKDVLLAWDGRRGTYNNEKVDIMYVCTSTLKITVPMPYRSNGDETQKHLNTLKSYCRNCRIGYSKDNLKYLSETRKELKNNR